MNPTENEAKAARVPVTGSKDGKKTWLKIRAAAVPKMKKSYHSIIVPMRLAKATLRDDRREASPQVWRAVSRRVRDSPAADTEEPYRCVGRGSGDCQRAMNLPGPQD